MGAAAHMLIKCSGIRIEPSLGLNRAFVWRLMSRIIEITYLKSSANCTDAAEPLEMDLKRDPLQNTFHTWCPATCNPCIIETKRNLFLQFVAAPEIPFSNSGFVFITLYMHFCLSQKICSKDFPFFPRERESPETYAYILRSNCVYFYLNNFRLNGIWVRHKRLG